MLEVAAGWLLNQVRKEADARAWAGLKGLLVGSQGEKSLLRITRDAMYATVVASVGDGASADDVGHISEVLDQLWPHTEITPTGDGTLLVRVEAIARAAMVVASEPIDLGDEFEPTSSLAAIQRELDLDPDEFAVAFSRRWVQAVRDRAVTDDALAELGNQLAHDTTHQALTLAEQSRTANETVHSNAIGLSVSRDEDEVRLWVTNRGTHQVEAIEINAIPADEDWHRATHGSLPLIDLDPPKGVDLVNPIAGGWFYATVDRLSPGRGLAVAAYSQGTADYDSIDFDISWIDHAGQQRKCHAVVDLGQVRGDIAMQPRPLRT